VRHCKNEETEIHWT